MTQTTTIHVNAVENETQNAISFEEIMREVCLLALRLIVIRMKREATVSRQCDSWKPREEKKKPMEKTFLYQIISC